jgi:nitroreductase
MSYEKISQKRTIRLFRQEKIDYSILEKCVDAARLSSSGRNSQPLEYIIIEDNEMLSKMFQLIMFGGYVSEDRRAKKGYEPTALIAILAKKEYAEFYKYDVGIAAQNIAMVAYEHNIGSCMMGRIDREGIRKALNIPEDYIIDLVIALGYPAEKPVVEETDSKTEVYRDDKGILHIPKRKLKDILHKNRF